MSLRASSSTAARRAGTSRSPTTRLSNRTTAILPEIGTGLGEYVLEGLRRRGIEVHLRTRLESAEGGRMRLSNGESFDADTLVWTTGVKPHPLVARLGFPLDERGKLIADECLRALFDSLQRQLAFQPVTHTIDVEVTLVAGLRGASFPDSHRARGTRTSLPGA
jgi:NADH dehydrogenase FAD-containing subunit